MSKTMTYGDAAGTLKVAVAIATAMLLVVGLVYFIGVRNTFAVAPSDYGLTEGDTISAAGSDDPDVYIVNEHGFKRLFLNPVIFGFYGHLGGFAAVKSVSPATRDAFGTSGLFRNCETNDEKVYGVETTGEDTGMLHWVNTSGAQAVADDADFFKKVFCINSNEFNWYSKGTDYTSVSQVPSYSRTPGATPAPTGPLSVALAPDNPAAKTITINAVGVEFLKTRFSGSGTINSVTVRRLGAGETNDFANVYVYDGAKRLTSGKSFSSATGEVTFINLDVSVSGTKDLSIVADMETTNNAGNVNYLSLSAVGASGTVSGLPVSGNNFSTAGVSSGTVDTARAGALGNPNVGQKHAQLSEFKITTNTEAASIKRMTLIQGGSLKPADLTNITLETGTNVWNGSVTSDGYLVFDMGSGFSIAKGANAIFKVYGDLAGKSTETVILYFENNSDLLAVGDQYGQGMAEGTNTLDSSATTEAHNLTLQGGVLTITYNGPNTANIGTDTSDTVFLKYTMLAATNIEVRKTRFTWCWDDTGSGTFNDAHDTTDGFADVLDVKVTDEDTGQVVMGPHDGSAFITNQASTCDDSATGAGKQFTDIVDLSAGVVKSFKVTADVKTSNSAAATADLDNTDKIKIVLENYADDTPSVTIMKYSGTTTQVEDADIVPNADISGSEMTINTAALTLGLAATPGSQTFIKGTTGVDMVGITFAAGQASSLKVTDITLTGWVEDETGDTANDGAASAPDASVTVGNAITNVRLYEAESGALVAGSDKVSNNSLSVANTGTIKFSFASTPWTIPAGSTKTLLVKVDLSTNPASMSALTTSVGDNFSFDINTTSHVTALDEGNNTVNPTAASVTPNAGATQTKMLTVKNTGSVAIAQAPSSPAKSLIYWGQTNVPVSTFRLTSTDEAQFIEKFTIIASAATENTDAVANVKKVKLSYKNKAGATLTSEQSFTNAASANFGFVGDARPYIPKDSSLDILVSADIRTKAEGATQDTARSTTDSANQGASFSLDFSDTYDGSTSNGFKAVGEGSGAEITGGTSGIADVLGKNNHHVYRVYPKIDNVPITGSLTLIGTPDVLKFSITAMGMSDAKLLFDNQDTTNFYSGSIKFEVVASGAYIGNTAASSTFTVLDEANVTTDVMTATGDVHPSPNSSLTMDFGATGTPAGVDVEITGGQTKTFRVQFTNPGNKYTRGYSTNTGTGADYFALYLLDDENELINWVGSVLNTTADLDSTSRTGYMKNLPIYGPTFTR